MAYTLQIYFDFWAIPTWAMGLALMIGIRLPVNFRSPYQAGSIIEFWRRWHITLSRFLRDYLYIPLGGNRLGKQRRYANLMLTMLLGGVWHGAGWNFLIWGGLHGFYLSINHLGQNWRSSKKRRSASALTEKGLSWAIVLFAVVIAWVFFQAKTMGGPGRCWAACSVSTAPPAYEPSGVLRMMDLPVLVGPERLLLMCGGMVASAFAIALFLPNLSQIFGYP